MSEPKHELETDENVAWLHWPRVMNDRNTEMSRRTAAIN